MAAIDIEVGWGRGAIGAVDVRMRQPLPARLLTGLSPQAALEMLARLYAVCGQAQRACAELALAAARDAASTVVRPGTLEAALARESAQEHLWRLLLDWPRLLDREPMQATFADWYARCRASDAAAARILGAEIEHEWLGLPFAGLADFGNLERYDRWARSGAWPAAALFHALAAAARACRRAPTGATPAAGARGALASELEHPWIAALLAAGRALEAHVAARVVALATPLSVMAGQSPAAVEMDASSPAPGSGVALVSTARGMLEHAVTLAEGRIGRYVIRTPTEVNFAPAGPYVEAVLGLPSASVEAARRQAALWALAFDPCVSYAVAAEVRRDA